MFTDLRAAYEIWAKQQNISNLSVLSKTLKRRLQALGYEVGIYNGYHCIVGHTLAQGIVHVEKVEADMPQPHGYAQSHAPVI